MNRGEMITALMDCLRDEGFEGDDDDCESIANRFLDAILPQVSTLKELEALNSKVVLIDPDTGVTFWPTWPGWWRASVDRHDHESLELVDTWGPLTVVWQP